MRQKATFFFPLLLRWKFFAFSQKNTETSRELFEVHWLEIKFGHRASKRLASLKPGNTIFFRQGMKFSTGTSLEDLAILAKQVSIGAFGKQ